MIRKLHGQLSDIQSSHLKFPESWLILDRKMPRKISKAESPSPSLQIEALRADREAFLHSRLLDKGFPFTNKGFRFPNKGSPCRIRDFL